MNIPAIPSISRQLLSSIQDKIDQKTKPQGSLGKLEQTALQIALIQQTTLPELKHPAIVVFAADHGIAADGQVNPFPQAVTTQMVYNFLNGGAAINVFCRQQQLNLQIVDAGVNHSFTQHPLLIDKKIAMGTRNYLHEPAMSRDQCLLAIQAGADVVQQLHQEGCNIIGFGEMGIGNTSAASLLMCCYTGIPLANCIGAGTGSNAQQLVQKKAILQQALNKQGIPTDPLQVLATFGGFEIAMISGAILKAASLNMIVVIDGFIVTTALLAAVKLQPASRDYCLFAHTSNEKGHEQLLHYLEAQPLLQLDMRLGEGTGAAIAMPLIQNAVAFLREMASFSDAGVAGKH
ncbi:nicotinate-nucleotide--dimethylbenzimidazole phosphoribosyltransferase [Chitinophaga pendula]|uniref:nicotinate-nucleotide--dimethylbenzimidazole phosphoribosyltransferase n=1 Tax=Chitinophaga TaxID=79328 RepID=UPI000BAE9422|nr:MULTISPECIES: nicotinate-nucleotide--dimethylbenzimidazole phosphoribosyltransferase [Chitinophaga]ASZ10711.1 nicotinate-nucleotide--dimethylbenzimidazole phosphoribosyltransferase [Chitinophaga sp. MD30]UCJ06314.1 nicotinate-nucleotide--dimethylbenzimidazole phosphoribosyltransferase [Chitinophaga pendula]